MYSPLHRPSGKYVMEDLHRIGGIPALVKYLLKHTDVLDGSQLTVTGKTLAENYADVPEIDFSNQDVVRPISNPIKETGHLMILRGNLAPDSAVAKITGKEGLNFEGVAKVFDSIPPFFTALANGEITAGQVIIFRYQGPKGGPGMPEVRATRCAEAFSLRVALTFCGRCWVKLLPSWERVSAARLLLSQMVVSLEPRAASSLDTSCLRRSLVARSHW